MKGDSSSLELSFRGFFSFSDESIDRTDSLIEDQKNVKAKSAGKESSSRKRLTKNVIIGPKTLKQSLRKAVEKYAECVI